jgi:hypothetical protein
MPRHALHRLPGALAFVAAFSAGCDERIGPVRPSYISIPDPSRLSISGQVMEPAANAPVEGARVCWSQTGEDRCAVTGPDGTYLLLTDRPTYPPGVRSARLAPTVHKEGFEYRQSWIPDDFSGFLFWSPGLQRILRIEAGGSIAGTVYPQEGSGLVEGGDDCESCKRVQIAVQRTGKLTIRLTVGGDSLRLTLPRYEPRSLDAPIEVQAGENLIVLVTGSVVPTKFALSTSLTPDG